MQNVNAQIFHQSPSDRADVDTAKNSNCHPDARTALNARGRWRWRPPKRMIDQPRMLGQVPRRSNSRLSPRGDDQENPVSSARVVSIGFHGSRMDDTIDSIFSRKPTQNKRKVAETRRLNEILNSLPSADTSPHQASLQVSAAFISGQGVSQKRSVWQMRLRIAECCSVHTGP
jgi:hypothetical protein